MDKFDIQKLRELPIESVAERLGLKVTKHKCLCPFHADKHPSLSFSVSRNTFKCFVCDAHGGVIDLAMKVLGKNFLETCQWLATEGNIIINDNSRDICDNSRPEKNGFDASRYSHFFEHPYLNNAAREFLFEERRLDPGIIRWCRLNSYTDRNGLQWLQIPYYDMSGQLIGVQSRFIGAKVEGIPRFKFPYGSKCPIYNQPVLKMLKPQEPLFITEGASDCWAMLSSGHKAIAIPSATLLKKKDIDSLRSVLTELHTPLHMFPDADIPGERLFLQLKSLLEDQSRIANHESYNLSVVRHSLPAGCKDFSDYYLTLK